MFEVVLGGAFDRARGICVDRVTLGKWLALALASWLAYLGTGQANATANFGSNLGNLPQLPDWGYAALAGIAVIVALIGFVLWVGLTWIRSHGQVVFLDLVARDAEDLGASWSRTSALAVDLFRVRLMLDFAEMLVAGVGVGAGAVGSWALGASASGEAWRWSPLVLGSSVAGLATLIYTLLGFALDELVLPIAYARTLAIAAAARELLGLVQRDGGSFVAYLGIRLLAAILVGIVAGATSCLLCAVAWLPFVSSLILVPFRVYLQGLPLAFLHRQDPEGCGAFAPVAR